jgi:hypothetical protein
MNRSQAIEAVVDDFRRILAGDRTIEDGERIRLADAFCVYRLLLISLGYDVYDVRDTTHSVDASISVEPLAVIDL